MVARYIMGIIDSLFSVKFISIWAKVSYFMNSSQSVKMLNLRIVKALFWFYVLLGMELWYTTRWPSCSKRMYLSSNSFCFKIGCWKSRTCFWIRIEGSEIFFITVFETKEWSHYLREIGEKMDSITYWIEAPKILLLAWIRGASLYLSLGRSFEPVFRTWKVFMSFCNFFVHKFLRKET